MSIQSNVSGVLQQGLQSIVAHKVNKAHAQNILQSTQREQALQSKPQFDAQKANEVVARLEAQLNARVEQNQRLSKIKENLKSRGDKRKLSDETLRRMYEHITKQK